MVAVTVEGMKAVEQTKQGRQEALRKLTSKVFNLNDEEQQAQLNKYLNDFEYNVNLMYLYQGMSSTLTVWGGSWVAGLFLRIPDTASHLLNLFLYCGAAGYILQNFCMNEFHSQLVEMQTIYNWCLKKNQANYDGYTDNTAIIAHPNTLRMIRLMAPLCSTEFMLVWKRAVEVNEAKNSIWSGLSNAYSLFTGPKPNVDLNRLQDLKTSVERRELDVGIYKGVEAAIRYFMTNTNFREILSAKLTDSIGHLKGMLPGLAIFRA